MGAAQPSSLPFGVISPPLGSGEIAEDGTVPSVQESYIEFGDIVDMESAIDTEQEGRREERATERCHQQQWGQAANLPSSSVSSNAMRLAEELPQYFYFERQKLFFNDEYVSAVRGELARFFLHLEVVKFSQEESIARVVVDKVFAFKCSVLCHHDLNLRSFSTSAD
jgi:hypothetical protein